VGGTGAGLQKVVEYADGQGLTEFWVWERDFVWQGAKRLIVPKHGVVIKHQLQS
jgi:hypothetical protein